MELFITDNTKELQGDIFGNWKPIHIVDSEKKLDNRFYNKLKKENKKKEVINNEK